MYQLLKDDSGNVQAIFNIESGAYVPIDTENRDYVDYLTWVSAGNVAPDKPKVIAIPQSVTRFQAKAALANAGLLDKVEAMMTDTNTPILYRLAWAEAQAFERQSATVKAMSVALGLTDPQLDALFTAAAAITG